ncbi:MAG TPA: hypothetical protein VLE03_00505, partial [Nitrospiraceae bacterium]|nr:hypothetical protein [Nitrospiraceae bacterium]
MLCLRLMALLGSLCLGTMGVVGCDGAGGSEETLPLLPAATDLTLQLVTPDLTAPLFMTAA